MSILLTEEDLDKLAVEYPLLDFSFEDDYREEVEIMRKAQLKKVAEWGDGECPHSGSIRRCCPKCWQELLKEAGLK